MSSPAVPLTLIRSAWPSPAVPPSAAARSRLTLLTPVPLRSLTVIVSVPPRALKSTRLDARCVHGDVAGVAEELEPASVGGDVDLFGCCGAVEDHPVVAVLALDDVAAVARIPDERVVARAHQGRIGSTVAVDRVVAAGTEQQLRSRAAGQGVVPVAAVERRGDRVREDAVRLVDAHCIVAVAGVDVDAVDVLALEVERMLASVSDVDLEHVGLAGLEAELDRVVAGRPRDRQHAVLQLRVLKPLVQGTRCRAVVIRRSGLALGGHDPGCADDDGRHRRHRHQQPTRACLAGLVVSEVGHDVPSRVDELSSARDTADGAPIPARIVRAV